MSFINSKQLTDDQLKELSVSVLDELSERKSLAKSLEAYSPEQLEELHDTLRSECVRRRLKMSGLTLKYAIKIVSAVTGNITHYFDCQETASKRLNIKSMQVYLTRQTAYQKRFYVRYIDQTDLPNGVTPLIDEEIS